MSRSAREFAQLLTEAIYRIRFRESKLIQAVQDELGYALDKAGGSAVEYWRKGHIPSRIDEVEKLTQELVRRRGLTGPEQIEPFLCSAGHPDPAGCCERLLVAQGKRALPQPHPSSIRTPEPNRVLDRDAPSTDQLAPFVAGSPITHPWQFFGRKDALRRIFGLWRRFPLQNVALIGPHRSGKTSLLHYLQTITTTAPARLRPGQRSDWLPQPERYQWILIDFQDPRMCDREMLLRYILDHLGIPSPDPCDLPRFMDAVSRLLRTPTLILMDEIDVALHAPELDLHFWWSLRSLGSNQTAGNLGFLLTSPTHPAQLAQERGKPSPFFNIFGHTLTLGPLSEEEAQELIASSPWPISPDDADWMLVQSGRWPALLQILCSAHLIQQEVGQPGEDWRAEGLRQMAPYRYLLGEE